MSKDTLTIGDLYRAEELTEEDLAAVATGWLEDRIEGSVPIGRHAVDVAAAVKGDQRANETLENEALRDDQRIAAIRDAMLRAPALKP